MTYYNVDKEPMTHDELVTHIIDLWKHDREAARLLIYEHGISWHALALAQREEQEYREAEKVVTHRES